MAIRRRTLRLLRHLAAAVGHEADEAVRALTRSWVRAWDDLRPGWRLTVADLADMAARLGRWPSPWQTARLGSVDHTITATHTGLTILAADAATTISRGAASAVAFTADAEPGILASQFPNTMADEAAARFAAQILPSALDVITRRAEEQITALTRPLSADATDAVKRALVHGVRAGDHPNKVARDMLDRVEGAFNGGLNRATTIARTELLSAYREASHYAHQANADVLEGWVWLSQLDRRSCISCMSMHGRTFGLDIPGPDDHQQGRCTRLPKTRSWKDLGIDLDEPDDEIPDARAQFDALPEADQIRLLGRAKLDLLRSGAIDWSDLASRRSTDGWRDSWVPTSLRDLQRLADLRNRRSA